MEPRARRQRAGWDLYGPIPPAEPLSASSLATLCLFAFRALILAKNHLCLFVDILMSGVCVARFHMVLAHLSASLWVYERAVLNVN